MTVRTVGVEEEFLLFEAARPRLADIGPDVVAAADREAADGDAQFEKELKKAQVEHASSPTESLSALARQLGQQRAELAEAANGRGARLIASGTSPVGDDSATTDDERYRQMEARFARIERTELTCAMHIHVSVESDDEGVAVLDRIAPWLPVLAALSANSPFSGGRDSGYESYRRVVWGQWPTATGVAGFENPAQYRTLVADLIATGAARDEAMIYFDARLSVAYPTVEIRVCDVCIGVDEAVLLAGLSRALVETAAPSTGGPRLRPELLRAASWRAARFGMTGQLVDLPAAVGSARLADAWVLVDALVAHVQPALEQAGDEERIRLGLKTIRAGGTGAQRQRAAADTDGIPGALEAARVLP